MFRFAILNLNICHLKAKWAVLSRYIGKTTDCYATKGHHIVSDTWEIGSYSHQALRRSEKTHIAFLNLNIYHLKAKWAILPRFIGKTTDCYATTGPPIVSDTREIGSLAQLSCQWQSEWAVRETGAVVYICIGI